MTLDYTRLPRSRDINDAYYNAQVDWCIKRLIKHVMIVVGYLAIVLVSHGSGLVELPHVLLVTACLAIPLAYLFVATNPTRLEARFQKLHPYSDFADPRDR